MNEELIVLKFYLDGRWIKHSLTREAAKSLFEELSFALAQRTPVRPNFVEDILKIQVE